MINMDCGLAYVSLGLTVWWCVLSLASLSVDVAMMRMCDFTLVFPLLWWWSVMHVSWARCMLCWLYCDACGLGRSMLCWWYCDACGLMGFVCTVLISLWAWEGMHASVGLNWSLGRQWWWVVLNKIKMYVDNNNNNYLRHVRAYDSGMCHRKARNGDQLWRLASREGGRKVTMEKKWEITRVQGFYSSAKQRRFWLKNI